MHRDQNDLFLTYMILTNKLNSSGGDVQPQLYKDDQEAVQTIPSRNDTIIAGIFNKIPNQTTSRFSTCELMYNHVACTSKDPWKCYE